MPVVIPDRYTQYPGALAPAVLFGGTWQAMYEEDGVFFRTGGGEALPFGEGIQEDAMQRMEGAINGVQGWNPGSGSGVLIHNRSSAVGTGGSASTTNNFSFRFDNANDPNIRTANENRPRNMTIRVWERI